MTVLLSGSGMPRARACPAAFALPTVTVPESTECSDGTSGHLFLSRIAQGWQHSQALLEAPEHLREFFASIDLAKIPRGEPEVAFAYDVISGKARFLRPQRHREYDVSDTEIPGTADLIAWPIDAEPLRIIDWKFPSSDHDTENTWPQLEFYALAASVLCSATDAQISIGIVNEDGSIGFHSRTLDWEDFARIATETTATWTRVIEARALREAHETECAGPWMPDVTSGPHCQYCPAFVHCPGKRAAVAAFLGTVPNVLTADDAGRAYASFKAAEKLGQDVHALVKTLLGERGELPTGDGQIVRLTRNGSVRISRAREVTR